MSGLGHVAEPDLVAAYTDAHDGARASADAARRFVGEFGSVTQWSQLSLTARLDAPSWAKPVVAWAVLAGWTATDSDYVVACGSRWGAMAARLHPDQHQRFGDVAAELGFSPRETARQWSVLAKLTAISGATSPLGLRPTEFATARDALFAATRRLRQSLPNTTSTPTFGLHATLFHLGVVDDPPPKKPSTTPTRAVLWEPVEHASPELAATMRRYIDQIALSLRPASVALIDTSLRTFACWLHAIHAEVTRTADIRRDHIEDYKAWLAAQTGYRGKKLSISNRAHRLGDLRAFFDRTLEWDWPDTVTRPLIFAGDLPAPDRPLPRFLDDAAATALLRAARAHEDQLVRLVVETLARTGLRKGELLGLTVDAIVQIGVHHWLRVPVGKLHTDRYIPLHPAVKDLLDDWMATRGHTVRSDRLLVERGRPVPSTRIDRAVADCATRAGLGHVTPHQLRHTLATQAINRGMSLEAIAALLGHHDLTMTLTYARIADHTVADEYFTVSQQVESLYHQPTPEPTTLPAVAEGPHMSKLRGEVHHRLLGNGWCTRPAQLDCRYESICESCVYFATTTEHLPILQGQRDDAAAKHQTDRVDLFTDLISKLDQQTA